MDKPNYYKKNRDALLNKSKEYYRYNRELLRKKYKSLSEDKKIIEKNTEKIRVMNKNKDIKKLEINVIKINIIA